MTTQNPHYDNMIAAKRAYDDHIRAMHAKYGHLHSDDRLTVEEAMERVVLSGNYKKQSQLFVAHREAHGV